MKKLIDIYDIVKNPLSNDETLKKIIELYFKNEKEYKDDPDKIRHFYKLLQTIESKDKNRGCVLSHVNILYKNLFENWQENIINMTPDKYKSIYGNEGDFFNADFQSVQRLQSK